MINSLRQQFEQIGPNDIFNMAIECYFSKLLIEHKNVSLFSCYL